MATMENEARIAKHAVDEASKILLRHSASVGGIRRYKKEGGDFATQADLDAEKEIIRIIRASFPLHGIVSEERGELKGRSSYTWVVDPLDGTRNFARGLPLWGCMLSLTLAAKPLVSAISLPPLGETYIAIDGMGAYLGNRRLRVSNGKQRKPMVVFDGMHTYGSAQTRAVLRKVERRFHSELKIFGTGAVCGAYIAKGAIDGMIMVDNPAWDTIPIVGLVKEAGGRVSGIHGEEWSASNKYCILSNGAIHDELISALR